MIESCFESDIICVVIDSLRDRVQQWPEGSDERAVFEDAADALDDAVELIDRLAGR